MRLCKDCAHFVPATPKQIAMCSCAHAREPVHGDIELSCSHMRGNQYKCGATALFFRFPDHLALPEKQA